MSTARKRYKESKSSSLPVERTLTRKISMEQNQLLFVSLPDLLELEDEEMESSAQAAWRTLIFVLKDTALKDPVLPCRECPTI